MSQMEQEEMVDQLIWALRIALAHIPASDLEQFEDLQKAVEIYEKVAK